MPFQGWHVPGCSAFRVQFLQGKALPQTGTFQVHCKGLSGMEYWQRSRCDSLKSCSANFGLAHDNA